MNDFGKKLKELRGDQSIREASRNIGISHTYLDSLEKGIDPRTGKERKPTIEVIHKLSKYYNVDFFDLSRLAGVFVSIKDTPKEVKREEINKMKKRFKEYFNDTEIIVKENYLDIMSKKLSSREIIFWQNLYNFYIQEKDSDYLKIKDEADTDILTFIASFFKTLTENKHSNDDEIFKDISNDFNKFLKSYLNIK
ncbi:helix-turn-helix transcriptional regulator [Staphylococcus epidermidis]|uniref:Helix-turn-helix n=8 Tax=Staphylococcus TaxID=1279 RepID=A0A380FZG5_9STAP|nr:MULTISPECIES: helix-turn-helix transcriptional regulator [Staphylococcus]MBF9291253.1 helix-turn-helix transcriptional regulator [Staphylococcus epidermidis]MBM5904507.1 helix-turn-helix transcriptional regulator [Staphylococcus epidermidis]MBM5913540.1 helix-turn-helix transcriptional regulator [Staphylococcus epidermidis]MBM5918077.1 helix-turn-helix transcriptional regulator [Staphylococcus epidermidis]MBM5920379.1 helix-turn-helix transcriptional regulator [Staphylococcus epidermidis]